MPRAAAFALCLLPAFAWAKDRDRDKVPDDQDRCPDVAGPVEGCPAPVDSDGDGVADPNDACPAQAAATANGCPAAPAVSAVRNALELPLTGSCHGRLVQHITKPTGARSMLWACDDALPVELYLPTNNTMPDPTPEEGLTGTLTWGIYLQGSFEGRAWLWIKTDDGRRIQPVNPSDDVF